MYEEALDELRKRLKDDEFAAAGPFASRTMPVGTGKGPGSHVRFAGRHHASSCSRTARTKIAGLKLLCETAERLGVHLTLATLSSTIAAGRTGTCRQHAG